MELTILRGVQEGTVTEDGQPVVWEAKLRYRLFSGMRPVEKVGTGSLELTVLSAELFEDAEGNWLSVDLLQLHRAGCELEFVAEGGAGGVPPHLVGKDRWCGWLAGRK